VYPFRILSPISKDRDGVAINLFPRAMGTDSLFSCVASISKPIKTAEYTLKEIIDIVRSENNMHRIFDLIV
jgi:hypothetical protein